jgi:hypothetical protein
MTNSLICHHHGLIRTLNIDCTPASSPVSSMRTRIGTPYASHPGMSIRKGITTWVLATGSWKVAYRRNMRFSEAIHTFRLSHGRHTMLVCGPFLAEW